MTLLTDRDPPAAETAGPVPGRRRFLLPALVAAGLAGLVLAVALGPVTVPMADTVRVLVGAEPTDPRWEVVIGTVRFPRALTAVLAGAALGVAGLMMQTLFRNPLADPYVLGVSSGAGLGVAIFVAATTAAAFGGSFGAGLVGLGRVGAVGAAAAGAGAVLVLVLALSRWVRSAVTLLIVGVMVGSVTTAVVSLVLVWTDPRIAQQFLVWGLGSFDATNWADLAIFAPCGAVGLMTAVLLIKPLNAMLLGDGYARSMGVNVRRVQMSIMMSAALLAGAVTAFCGPIGFIGIAIPHLARILLGTSDHRVLLPATLLVGSLTALACTIASHPPGTETVIPLNVVTSLVGAPVVIGVLLRGRRMAAGALT
ncbi:FecCD family ABC transporter permease [Pseudonocardia asaccharolytica]|uniref:Iron ABC transporter n=1 Tax=Pseudonocardia asaccharolytica DSM 44247 = NBRC 16224 TaxID=1123024 RepID=A0A511D685_9PSEU|nr:iron ABC transporter permease [Pseudonocardia asaccharolytica]GEL20300.1 iron ABC transporter [Pseudonocardia asaccharolytica DSM 44247 = NBRC 16224]